MGNFNTILQSAPLDLYLPSGVISTHILDFSTDALEIVFQAPEACTITNLGFLYGARAGTPPTYLLQLEGVSLTTGRSDGTVKGATNNCKTTFTPPATTAWDGLWKWSTTDFTALTETYTCTRGELLAIVIKYSSGTVTGANSSTFAYGFSAGGSTNLPYSNTVNSGTNTRRAQIPPYGYKSSTKTYGFLVQGYSQNTYSSDTTPDEVGNYFLIPAECGFSYQLGFVDVYVNGFVAGKSMKVQVYDGTTVKQTVTIDSDAFGSNASNGLTRIHFTDTNLTNLYCGNGYRVAFQPQETGANFRPVQHDLNSANDFQDWPFGTNCYKTTRTDAGAWSNTTTSRIRIDLGITNIAAVGRGIMQSGMPVNYRR